MPNPKIAIPGSNPKIFIFITGEINRALGKYLEFSTYDAQIIATINRVVCYSIIYVYHKSFGFGTGTPQTFLN